GAKRKLFHILLGSAALCLVLEVLQMLLRRGSFDVDDIILSVFGAFLGVFALRLVSNITSGTLQKPERARS
ncbi:MAG TPA: VanZ family protein, partial [Candidatus Ruthenibacterium avium]|nr:VanZ family protein [Candidatus Ruthenibacterium avium]